MRQSKRTVWVSDAVPDNAKVQLWAYGYADIAAAIGFRPGDGMAAVALAAHRGKFDPRSLVSVLGYIAETRAMLPYPPEPAPAMGPKPKRYVGRQAHGGRRSGTAAEAAPSPPVDAPPAVAMAAAPDTDGPSAEVEVAKLLMPGQRYLMPGIVRSLVLAGLPEAAVHAELLRWAGRPKVKAIWATSNTAMEEDDLSRCPIGPTGAPLVALVL